MTTVETPLFSCPVVSKSGLRCSNPVGHDDAHVHYDDQGHWRSAWVTREEFEAARERGEFDHHYCRCSEPEPGDCLNCGGEIL